MSKCVSCDNVQAALIASQLQVKHLTAERDDLRKQLFGSEPPQLSDLGDIRREWADAVDADPDDLDDWPIERIVMLKYACKSWMDGTVDQAEENLTLIEQLAAAEARVAELESDVKLQVSDGADLQALVDRIVSELRRDLAAANKRVAELSAALIWCECP